VSILIEKSLEHRILIDAVVVEIDNAILLAAVVESVPGRPSLTSIVSTSSTAHTIRTSGILAEYGPDTVTG